MSNVITICKLNISLLLKDKLSFFWSLVLPSIMLFFNSRSITSVYDLTYWWIYIVFNAFIYGIGLFALNEKDTGALSIIFSIKWIPVKFFFGLLLTQLIYSIVCLTMFNLIPAFFFNLNYIHLTGLSLITIVVVLPVAFIGYNITYLRNLYSSTVSSICNMVIFLFFVVIGMDVPINVINPFIIIGSVMNDLIAGYFSVYYFLICTILIIVSIPSIIYFTPLSRESR
ncbi:PrgI family protein [Enterococcus faecium]|nr:PrgI family protein [Enterococcus faecium]PQC89439.1 hypothetical protein CUN38_13280 [Enterococcus faecium]